MIFIFLLALVLFGPKKLPELGRTIGKAMTEFRRASNELKSTFDREMRNLEAETQLKDVARDLQLDTYNYDYSAPYEHSYESSYSSEAYESPASNPATESASATKDAELPSAATPEGVIARGANTEPEQSPAGHPSETPVAPPAGHNA
jgi:TatA/E family protein of Tat protein translocase